MGGADFDMPLFPIEQFFIRHFTWDPVLLAGSDYSMRLAGLYTFTASQALLKAVGLPLGVVERIYFIFWYALTGFSMYYFICAFAKEKNIKASIIQVSGVIFYMINFYQLHIWMIARKPELSGAITIPFVLGLMIRAFRGEVSNLKVIGYMAVFSLLGCGMGLNPPVLGIFIMSVVAIFLFRIFYDLCCKSGKTQIATDFKIVFLVTGIFILTNLYWILPTANYVIQSGYTDVTKTDDVFALKSLLETTSRHNSFLNVLRMYGDANFFDGYKGELYLPFFHLYQTNRLLILFSVMFSVLAFAGIVSSRNRYALLFGLITIVSIFLSKGIHPPFENIFFWLFRHIPGFWVYRAPWQKFGLLITLGYSFLASLTVGEIYSFFKNRLTINPPRRKLMIPPLAYVIAIVLLIIGYNYAFIFGKMIPTTEERKTLPGFHQKYPHYLFEARDWVNSMKGQFNIILLPDDKANAYEWGYGGAYDITLKIFNKGLVFRQYGEGMSPPHSLDKVYQSFVSSLYKKTTPFGSRILSMLGVRYILHRNDFIYDWAGDNDSPDFIRSCLAVQQGIRLVKTFGKWDFYKVDDSLPMIYTANDVVKVEADVSFLSALVSSDCFKPGAVYLFSDDIAKPVDFIPKIVSRQISIPRSDIKIPITDGWESPVSWDSMSPGSSCQGRAYPGSKPVISCTGGGAPDMLSTGPEGCVYGPPSAVVREHGAYDSTLIYIKTSNVPLEIGGILTDGRPASDIVGIWRQSGNNKISSDAILYPLSIPPKQKVIIQINHLVKGDVVLLGKPGKPYCSPQQVVGSNKKTASLLYQKINPTRYLLRINADNPFMLIFNERYNPGWKAYYRINNFNAAKEDKQTDFSALINAWHNRARLREIKKHMQVNGFANGWWVELPERGASSQSFEIMLEYIPQRLFESGLIISILTLVLSLLFVLFKHKRR